MPKQKTASLKYVYFIAYNLMTDKGIVVGNTDTFLDEPITTLAHIREVEERLNKAYNVEPGVSCVSVVNFQFLNTITI